MSSAGDGSREWRFHVADMLAFADKVCTYTSGMDQATFVNDAVTCEPATKMPVWRTCHECRRHGL